MEAQHSQIIMNQLSTPQTKCWALAKLRSVAQSSPAFALGRVVLKLVVLLDKSHSGANDGTNTNFRSARQFASLDKMALDVISSPHSKSVCNYSRRFANVK